MVNGKWLMVNGLQGRTRGASPEGGTHGGGSFNITSACISLPQAIYILHCIALH